MTPQPEPESHVSGGEASSHLIAEEKLPWLGNPVIYEDDIPPPADPQEIEGLQHVDRPSPRYNFNTAPRFRKHHESTTLEEHTVDDSKNLLSYVGYITLLWCDWFLVTLYDVRYLTDSVAERVGRAVHLGVMLGFAVVSAKFTPDQQSGTTFRVTSIALAVSRFSLSIRYSFIVWHIRHFKEGKRPLIAVAAVNILSAAVYLGTAFRFREGKNSHIYILWYVVIVVETLLQVVLSRCFKVLSFSGTHLTERMTVATLFMLAEGVSALAENVVLIVQNNAWTSATIGNLTAGVSNIYFVFMIYFDWIANHKILRGNRQFAWAVLHFPFHLALLLFMEGSTQFVQWWKIYEVLDWVGAKFDSSFKEFQEKISKEPHTPRTEILVQELNTSVVQIFDKYEVTYFDTVYEIDQVFSNISTIPNEWWDDEYNEQPNALRYQNLLNDGLDELSTTVTNSILANFNVDPIKNIATTGNFTATTEPELQGAALQNSADRFTITFKYTFISAGLTLVSMVLFFAIGRPPRSWSPSVASRMTLFMLLGIGLSLIAIAGRDDQYSAYPYSPWLLPTLALAYFLVLVLTHFPRRLTSAAFALWPRVWPRGRRGVKQTGMDSQYYHISHGQFTGVDTMYDGQAYYNGMPTHTNSYSLETYGEQAGNGLGK
ncbi:hypothetical protein F5Y10DRAFT_294076 [Nemania abortiva]|nr:hypothetical protein F5Y10DRAFT_294076 [Nemania abortiva]